MAFELDKFLFGDQPSQEINKEFTTTDAQRQALNELMFELSKSISGGGPQLGEGAGGGIFGKINEEAGKVGALTDTARGAASTILQGGELTPGAQDLQGGFMAPILALLASSGVPAQATSTLEQLQTEGPSDFQDFFQQTVQEPALESLEEDILPNIRGRFAPSGFYSGERLKSERTAREDILDALTRERARTAFQTRESQRDRALEAARAQGGFGIDEQATGVQGLLGAQRSAVSEADSRRGLLSSALRSVPGIEGAALDALPTDLLLGQLQADTAALDALIDSIQTQVFENIVFNNPGSTGVVQDFFKSGGGSEIAKRFP